MGERKGQNKYYPPDYDPKKGGLNKFLGTHALRERARKIHMGIIIIRFEMPYNIWCEGCKNHIGMGVRYNAEKTKVGMYYTTPVYKFRMKCHLCNNHFEIQTDPASLDYVILSGAQRQENRWDPLQNEQVVPETKEVQKRLFDDAMFKLEHQAKDAEAGEQAKPRLEKLYDRNRHLWDDCYDSNSRLRAEFRNTKKDLKKQAELDNKILAKNSLDLTLLPETDQDKHIASLMFLQTRSAQEREEERRLDILLQPSLPGATKTTFGGLKRQKQLNKQLKIQDLGIKKKCESKTEKLNSNNKTNLEVECEKDTCTTSPSSNILQSNVTDKTENAERISENTASTSKISSLALVCTYDSSASATEDSE